MPSPVVRAPPSSVEDAGLILVQGFKIPYTVGCSQKKFFLIEKKIRRVFEILQQSNSFSCVEFSVCVCGGYFFKEMCLTFSSIRLIFSFLSQKNG